MHHTGMGIVKKRLGRTKDLVHFMPKGVQIPMPDFTYHIYHTMITNSCGCLLRVMSRLVFNWITFVQNKI